MKQKYIVFLVVFFIAILTVFSVNVNTESDVEYTMIQIGANESNNTSSVNLILKEHPTENLTAIVKDKNYNDVNNVPVTWISSDTSVVTVDETGKLQALKVGKSTITAKVSEDITDTCEVTVYAEPYFTYFKNAKYETELVTNVENLKISNITLEKSNNYSYYFMITSDNKKPDLKLTKSGAIDHDAMSDKISFLSINNDENYLYTRKLAKYCELNKDIYLWVVQETKLQDWYYNTNKDFVGYSTNFVVQAQKIERAPLPQLNLILQSFNIGYWTNSSNAQTDNYSYMRFNFPTETENRKFTVKVGKVTNTDILNKIKNNNYSGITELLSYAKNNNAVYSQSLTTTSLAYYRSDSALFDGRKLLEDKSYYYIYVVFDDENGKYYPIEGVTLGQAWFSSSTNSWDLYAYTSGDFKWDNLSSTYVPTTPNTVPNNPPANPNVPVDNTTSKDIIPFTGSSTIIIISIILFVGLGIVFYKKYDEYKKLK